MARPAIGGYGDRSAIGSRSNGGSPTGATWWPALAVMHGRSGQPKPTAPGSGGKCDKRHPMSEASCDALVLGAGPAGCMAALLLRRAGLTVTMLAPLGGPQAP